MERRAGRQHDRQRHKIAECHADPGIQTNAAKAAGACSGASVSFSRRGCSRWSSASWDDCQKYR